MKFFDSKVFPHVCPFCVWKLNSWKLIKLCAEFSLACKQFSEFFLFCLSSSMKFGAHSGIMRKAFHRLSRCSSRSANKAEGKNVATPLLSPQSSSSNHARPSEFQSDSLKSVFFLKSKSEFISVLVTKALASNMAKSRFLESNGIINTLPEQFWAFYCRTMPKEKKKVFFSLWRDQ